MAYFVFGMVAVILSAGLGLMIGLRFARELLLREGEEAEELPEEQLPEMSEEERRNWENLLRYDGSVQEEDEE